MEQLSCDESVRNVRGVGSRMLLLLIELAAVVYIYIYQYSEQQHYVFVIVSHSIVLARFGCCPATRCLWAARAAPYAARNTDRWISPMVTHRQVGFLLGRCFSPPGTQKLPFIFCGHHKDSGGQIKQHGFFGVAILNQ